MRTHRIIFSILLLALATIFNAVFAQSAEEAAKYGQLQEIQIPAAGKLGKYIKKKDPNVTALKISGELNEKDLAILFSLPNIAYLDLSDAQNIATIYEFKGKDGKQEFIIDVDEFMLLCGNSLKYLAAPKNKSVISILPEVAYEFDCLVLNDKIRFINCGKERTERYSNDRLCHNRWEAAKNIKVKSVKIHSLNEGSNNKMLSQNISDFLNGQALREIQALRYGLSQDESLLIGGRIFCETMYIAGNGNSLSQEAKRALLSVNPQDIIIGSTGEKFLKFYYGDAKVVDLSSYDAIIAGAFKETDVEEVNLGEKITVIPEWCFCSCEQLKKITMPAVNTIRSGAFLNCSQLQTISMPAIDYIEQYAFDYENIELLSTIDYTYKVPADSLNIEIARFIGTGVKKIDLLAHPYAPNLTNTSTGFRSDFYWKFYDKFQQEVVCLIPNGARKHRYNTGEWEKLRVVEQGAKRSYAFRLDSIGSLKNYLTDDIVLNIDSLTLSGFMDETEFALIRQCKYIRYLDMTNLFTFASVEVAKANLSKSIAVARFVAALSNMQNNVTQAKYQDYEVDTETALRSEFSNKILQKLVPDKVSDEELDEIFGVGKIIPSDECYFPEGALEGLSILEEIRFPNKLLSLQRQNLFIHKGINPFTGREVYDTEDYTRSIQNLKKVRLSNELHTLGDFLFAESPLEDINFPDSLKIIGFSCFKNCNLTKVDLSKTNISTYQFYRVSSHDDHKQYLIDTNSKGLPLYVFSGSPIQELRLPKKITNAEWMGDKLSTYTKNNKVILYVYFKEPFCTAAQMAGAYGEIKEIHIPRGMKAAWNGYPNVIDDIDLGE